MIKQPIDISIPLLWKDQRFHKEEWGFVNFIVGANGTGKSLLAERLKQHFSRDGFTPRYLNAERLVGLEKRPVGYFGGGNLQRGFDIAQYENYKNEAENSGLSSSAIIILKQRLDVRIRIEATLSDIFGKTIRLDEQGGFLKAKMQNIAAGDEYSLSENECHGLKELITLLTFLYDPARNCLILDEPELHLHPQFQSFFLQEVRKIAGDPRQDPTKKLFFIITHSPYFIDVKKIDDLKSVIVCQKNQVPTYISEIDPDSEYVLSRFLPRFNTHHKQFFFSSNPVFVEGYTDQQIISLLCDKVGLNVGAAGSCIIDVGGKDELAVFRLLCVSLKIECRIIADLDALFRGKLRQVVNEDVCSQSYIQAAGLGTSLSQEIGNLEGKLGKLIDFLGASSDLAPWLVEARTQLSTLGTDEVHTKRLVALFSVLNQSTEFNQVATPDIAKLANFVRGRTEKLIEAFRTCNVFILPKGEVEHYYKTVSLTAAKATNKDVLFKDERDYILANETPEQLKTEYQELLSIINQAVPTVIIEITKHMKFEVFEWIHRVQTAIAKGEVVSIDDVRRNARINYELYQQIIELMDFTLQHDLSFTCRLKIRSSMLIQPLEVIFDHKTTAHSFVL